MKTLFFILFFPITVPAWLLYKLIPLFYDWLVDTLIPFLQHDVFPAIKRYLKQKSAEMEKNAEKLKQERENEKKDKEEKNEIVQTTSEIENNRIIQIPAESIEQEVIAEETIEIPLEVSVSFNTSSISNVDPKLEERVFILFYSVGTAKRYMRDCTNPDVFFENYSDAVDCLQELTKIENENAYPFYEPFPSEQLKELQEHDYYVNLVNEFIKRHWYKILNEASKYKTDAKINEKINSFKSNLEPFTLSIPNECQKFIEQLSALELDIHNLPKAPKKQIDFDSFTEQSLLNTLKNQTNAYSRHCCYNELIDFYFKYRNDYPKAVRECIKYCYKDIESIPEIKQAYIENEIQRISWLYKYDKEELETKIISIRERSFNGFRNSFDRITMLFFYEKDYESAIHYCKLAIQHGQDPDLKFTKRIERFKKKRAAEEKKLYGTALLHDD